MVQQQLPAGTDSNTGIWQHMVGVIMLNQTGRKPVKTVFSYIHRSLVSPAEVLESRRI
jgi:hypothetical protein